MSDYNLCIKINRADFKPCGICGEWTDDTQYTGAMLFIDGTDQPVCSTCGKEHDPDLAMMVSAGGERLYGDEHWQQLRKDQERFNRLIDE